MRLLDLFELAKELDIQLSVAVAHEYFEVEASSSLSREITELAKRLVELKKKGYPLMNSISYFKVIAKEKKSEGSLVLPCYVRNGYAKTVSVFDTSIKTAISGFNWKEIRKCPNCSLHFYVEPSLALSYDFEAFLNWAFCLLLCKYSVIVLSFRVVFLSAYLWVSSIMRGISSF